MAAADDDDVELLRELHACLVQVRKGCRTRIRDPLDWRLDTRIPRGNAKAGAERGL